MIRENRKLMEVLQKEKHNLQTRHSDLENEKVRDLEEKLGRVKKMYSEMKVHLVRPIELLNYYLILRAKVLMFRKRQWRLTSRSHRSLVTLECITC